MASSRRKPKKSQPLTVDGKPISQTNDLQFEGTELAQQISSVSSQIQTLDQLLAAAKVDLSVWEVDKYVANKWDTAARRRYQNLKFKKGAIVNGYSVSKDEWTVQPLWQVKVWLKRKAPQITATEELLKRIESKSFLIKPPKISVPHGKIRRSLEVSIMDPHIGLLAQAPESDAPQDLQSISELIMEAIEDLLQKAAPYGPFEQIFMPFGNDFVHADNVFHTTTAGTGQPEMIAWHRVYLEAETIALNMVRRLRQEAPVYIYEIPGNHSRMSDFTLARVIKATFAADPDVYVDASSSPYKFHRYGATLIGFEHGHSVKPIRLASLMANERKEDWMETEYREWHLGDQHRKGSSKPSMLEEQGVSVEYLPGLTAPNEWHRLKSFNHQKRGAMAFVYDFNSGPIARLQFNISQYTHKGMK